MKYLIDTHVCLWAAAESHKLSSTVKDILESPEHVIFYSQVSLFEIAIKFKTGKLPDFKITLEEFNTVLQQKSFTFQLLTNEHLFTYFNADFFSEVHKDPFDRCLAAIAYLEKIPFITKDDKFQLYKEKIEIIW
jgi:PIN domain nuclease of toxin-antitoxin system